MRREHLESETLHEPPPCPLSLVFPAIPRERELLDLEGVR